jgi:hypothetical protein
MAAGPATHHERWGSHPIPAIWRRAPILNRKRDSFVIPIEFQSEGYPSAEQKLRLEVFGFINDIKVLQ